MTSEFRFEIRRAGPTDAEDAFHLIDEYYREIGVLVRDGPSELEQYLLGEQSGIWLAHRLDPESRAIGCILLRPLPQVHGAGEIKRLYVRQSDRGAGVAQALLLALEQYASSRGLQWLYLDSKDDLQAALRFYQRSGYRPCDRYNENPQATVFMRKQLQAAAPARLK